MADEQRIQRLNDFFSWVKQHINGDEKGEAQLFLDRFFRAFGHDGLLRDWLPKGSDFRKVTATRLAQIQKMLNNRPRKCLNYRTPIEVLNDLPGVALRN